LKCERERRIVYNVLRICNEEKKNKELVTRLTPLKRAIARAVKTDGKSERAVKM
jgi:hypothetical protein